jgi:hypothetical protein
MFTLCTVRWCRNADNLGAAEELAGAIACVTSKALQKH